MIAKRISRLMLLNFTLSIGAIAQELPSYIPQDNLVGWWPFNGNPDDESMNGNSGINHGCKLTADRFGIENKAYYFDGIYSYIEVEMQNSSLQLKNNFTVSVWTNLKFNPYNSQSILCKGDNSSNEYSIICSNEQYLTINRENYDHNNLIYFSNHYNNWTNIICVYKTGIVLIYINGKFVAANVLNAPILPSSLSLVFGAMFNIGTNTPVNGSYCIGDIDDIGIWNRVLSTEEIYEIYLSSK